MNPGGGSGWDEAPLDIQIPDDARELDRDVLAYHRELRAQRRRNRLRRLTGPFSGPGTVMPLLASILAVCLVAGAMLSVATFSPAPADRPTHPATATGTASPAPPRSHATASQGGTSQGRASQTGASQTGASPTGTGSILTSAGASATGTGSGAAGPSATRPSRSASISASASARASASTARTGAPASPTGAG